MPYLVDAYLAWKSAPWSAYPINPTSLPEDITPLPERPETPEVDGDEGSESPLPSDVPSGEGDFVMQGVDTFGKLALLLHCVEDVILILSL